MQAETQTCNRAVLYEHHATMRSQGTKGSGRQPEVAPALSKATLHSARLSSGQDGHERKHTTSAQLSCSSFIAKGLEEGIEEV